MDRRAFLRAFGFGSVATAVVSARGETKPPAPVHELVPTCYDRETGISIRFDREYFVSVDRHPSRIDYWIDA
jgi:hypothetical protein